MVEATFEVAYHNQNAAVTFTSAEKDPDSPNPNDFEVVGTSCELGVTLPPGESCEITLSFTPGDVGLRVVLILYEIEEQVVGPFVAEVLGLGTDVRVLSPADGAVYEEGEVVMANFACDAGTVNHVCDSTHDRGTPINTAEPGTYEFSVTLTPLQTFAGEEHFDGFVPRTETVTYTVVARPDPPTIEDAIVFMDEAVNDGELAGVGPGASGGGRLVAVRQMILSAVEDDDSCGALREALARIGNDSSSFVDGPAATELGGIVQAVIENECS
jgi:hypothetical protein